MSGMGGGRGLRGGRITSRGGGRPIKGHGDVLTTGRGRAGRAERGNGIFDISVWLLLRGGVAGWWAVVAGQTKDTDVASIFGERRM